MGKKLNTRAVAAKLSFEIIDGGRSLDVSLGDYFVHAQPSPADRALIQELVYGVCRWYGDLDHAASQLLRKPIRNKDRVIHFVLLVGLYQLRFIATAEYAAVAETVAACQQLGRHSAKGLINGCLRSYQRASQSDAEESTDWQTLDSTDDLTTAQTASLIASCPDWLYETFLTAWPQHINALLLAMNQRPAMVLRVNRRQQSRRDYLNLLDQAGIDAAADPIAADGIILAKPAPVAMLPGFDQGRVSVQDTAAQLAADILQLENGQQVLDACAAPGGKAAHILERADVALQALDISARRCEQMQQGFNRLQLNAEVAAADASVAPAWTVPEGGYQRILIDAPCSGTGVIRRHPDIRHHRRAGDLDELCRIQAALLTQLWTLLAPGGLMLYMTCSILPEENSAQIASFAEQHPQALFPDFLHPSALDLEFGKQSLPGVHPMDGFYYCLLGKPAPAHPQSDSQ